MISLLPGSLCDVCAEEYGPHNYPHSIPCGHVMCLHCCNSILEKTSARLSPSCPFCRVQFTSDTIRLIRIDFGGSGWSTPRSGAEVHDSADMGSDDDILLLNPSMFKSRSDVRRLEHKVAKVAAKKCSVQEVTMLHKELQQWLTSDVKSEDQASSLYLSAALLRAILVNHVAHSDATKAAKIVEHNLRKTVDELETANHDLEAEMRKMQAQYAAKAQECHALRAELTRYGIKSATPTVGSPTPPPPTSVSSVRDSALMTPPRPQSTSSIPPSRPGATSPTSSIRTYTPSPLARSTTATHTRSASAAPLQRSFTPSIRSATPSSTAIPHKASRLSSPPPPPKMTRSGSSSSDEKEKEKQREKDERRVQLIQRWIPSIDASQGPLSGKPDGFHSHAGAALNSSIAASAPPPRYRTPLSTHSP
ncbi:hypothetical protein B0H21DRAFT_686066 [Amylocystis lapponica]|nr:hypothetical protein B0H21DRAFT_686066 [Amylocystis lapponica]